MVNSSCMLCESITEDEFNNLNFEDFYANTKADGERVLAVKKNNEIHLINRRGLDKSAIYPEIVTALEQLPITSFTIDGEVVSHDGLFNNLQRRALLRDPIGIKIRAKEIPVKYLIFDILNINNQDITMLPLTDRLPFLANFKGKDLDLEVMPYIEGKDNITNLWQEVNNNNQEGIVLKTKNGRYQFKRSYAWLKLKTWHYAELTFYSYENNDNSSITVSDNKGVRCLVSGEKVNEVKNGIDTNGKIDIKIKYLERTNNGAYRFIHFAK